MIYRCVTERATSDRMRDHYGYDCGSSLHWRLNGYNFDSASASAGSNLVRAASISGSAATLISHDISLRKMDGGGRRVAAFIDALGAVGVELDVVGVGPLGGEAVERAAVSRVHRAKRRLLPVPFRRRVESQLAMVNVGYPTISLLPSANRVALRSAASWLDFPDLWSEIAENHAATVDPISAGVNRVQASVWRRREASDSGAASVVSVASWSDRSKLTQGAVWLPTPVFEDLADFRRRRTAPLAGSKLTYGFLANFGYPPNRDAYRRLVNEWLPVLSPSADRVAVAGFGASDLPKHAGIFNMGAVEAVSGFYDAVDVVLAPIYQGEG